MNMKGVVFLSLTALLLLLSLSQSHAQVEVTTIHGETYIGYIIETNKDKILFRTTDDLELTFPKNYIEDIKPVIIRIVTFTGNKYEGRVLKQDDSTMIIETKGKLVLTVPKNQIFRLNYGDSYSTKTYRSFGITVLAPGGINISFGNHFKSTGIRTVIGYMGSVVGLQINYLFNLSKSEHLEHNISLGAGRTAFEDSERPSYVRAGQIKIPRGSWTYLGGYYDINVYGAFLELGLTAGVGDFTIPQLSIQFGYVYRFND